MTANQWKMLGILSRHDREGTMEVLLAWGGYDFGETPEQEDKAWRVCKFVVANTIRLLVAKGYASDDDDGYGITDRGLELLRRHENRSLSVPPAPSQ